MKREYTKKEYQEILSMQLTESALVRSKIEDAYGQIRTGGRKDTKSFYNKGLKGLITGMSAVAAALVLSVTVCVSNPALAAKLPFIGNIFQTVSEDSSYPGDFSKDAMQLVKPGEEENNPYVQTNNGITFTISECNYESMAMYLAVSIESEAGFSDMMQNFARYGSYAEEDESEMYTKYSTLYIGSTSTADFSKAGKGIYEGDPAKGTVSPYYIQGKFIDEHTFAGIIRVDLMHMAILDGADGWNYINNEDIPEEFAYTLKVTDIFADYEGEHLAGNWDFSFDVKLNHENTIKKEIGKTNEQGIGISKVTKTAYELYATLELPEGKNEADYCVAICDAEGKPLESQGEYAEIYSIYNRDVSKVTIYVVDYETYMNECKGNNYVNLPSKAVFQTEVEF